MSSKQGFPRRGGAKYAGLAVVVALALIGAALVRDGFGCVSGYQRQIVYTEGNALKTILANGQGESTLVDLTGDPGQSPNVPSWSADGTEITFEGFTELFDGLGTINVYTVLANGQGVTQRTDNTTDQQPEWDPLGNNIIYSSDRDDDSGDPQLDHDLLSVNTGLGGVEAPRFGALRHDPPPLPRREHDRLPKSGCVWWDLLHPRRRRG